MTSRARTAAEIESEQMALAALPRLETPIREGNFIYLATDEADPGADCWAWLRGFIDLAYGLIKANRLYEVRILFTYERRTKR